MYVLLFKRFLRTRTSKLGIALILVLGLISIMIGKQFLTKQAKTAEQVIAQQAEHIERNVALHKDDIGLLLYYLKFSIVNELNALAGISIGQRDVNPSVLSVKILTLEGQRYDTDLVNPTQLLYGNLDLSFLLVYVLPLIIIACTYNLRSEEEEAGTWRMVHVMIPSTTKYLLAKLLVRVVLLVAVMTLLFIVAGISLNLPWGAAFLTFFLTALLYLVFWFALSFWVVSLKRNSNFNALTLLSLWLGLLILFPATLNNLVTTKYPVPEALFTIIKQRDGYHQKWDSNKRATMEKFYANYPQFESYGFPPEEGFSWLWYFAMQHAGDAESETESLQMREKILQREEMSRKWAYFVPTMHTQLVFNELAGTNIRNHLEFLDKVRDFHEQKRLYFYPKIFSEIHGNEIEWENFQPDFFRSQQRINWMRNLLPLMVSILFFIGLVYVNTGKSSDSHM